MRMYYSGHHNTYLALYYIYKVLITHFNYVHVCMRRQQHREQGAHNLIDNAFETIKHERISKQQVTGNICYGYVICLPHICSHSPYIHIYHNKYQCGNCVNHTHCGLGLRRERKGWQKKTALITKYRAPRKKNNRSLRPICTLHW